MTQKVTAMVGEYEARLRGISSPIVTEPEIWGECSRRVAVVFANCLESQRVGRRADEVTAMEPSYPEVTASCLSEADVHRAATELSVICCDLLSREGQLPVAVAMTLAEGVVGLTQRLSRWIGQNDAETQRHWLAREIHDWLGSGISLAIRRLDLYEMHRDSLKFGAAEAEIDATRRALDDVLEGARTLVSGLQQHMPDTLLVEALRKYVRAAEPVGTTVEVDVRGDERLLSERSRTEIFVMIREGLRNALEHARAESVVAQVDIADGAVTATVQDDGIGLSSDAMTDPASAGLTSMRERADLLGGEIRLSSVPGDGTRLFLRIPNSDEAHARAS
jgi:signal transduction histidine kinase